MSSRFITWSGLSALGLLLIVFTVAGYRKPHVRSNADSVPPAAPTVSPTPTPPDARSLLAQAKSAVAAKHTVLEWGEIKSTNNNVYDGQKYWANFSWRSHRYHDSYRYREPITFSSQVKDVKKLRRVAVGQHLALWAHSKWFCKKRPAHANARYWSAPAFTLSSPEDVGAVQVGGQPAWDIRGLYSVKSSSSSSQLKVDVFVDQSTHLFRQTTESGTIRLKVRGNHRSHWTSARIRGTATYSDYGKPVKIKIPLACKS